MLALAVLILTIGYTLAYAGIRPGKDDKYAKEPWKLWTEGAQACVADGKLALQGKYSELAQKQKDQAKKLATPVPQGFMAGTIVPLPPSWGGPQPWGQIPQLVPPNSSSNPLLNPPFGPGSGQNPFGMQVPNPFGQNQPGPV